MTATTDLGPLDPVKPQRKTFDTSFEHALDPEPPRAHPPVYVDIVSDREHTRRPIIPAHLRGWANLRKTAERTLGRWWHITRFHAVRVPFRYLPLAVFWSVVGVFRLVGRQLRWYWCPELDSLLQQAATSGDVAGGVRVDNQLGARRSFRGAALAAEAVAVGVVGWHLIHSGTVWTWLVALGVVVPYLAHIGHPPDKPIVTSAIVAPRFRKLNSDIVLRAYYAAGLGHPDKPGQKVEFLSQMARDAAQMGSQVMVAMPYGTTFADVVKVKAKIASGLDVTEQQVYLTRDKTSTRSHLLYVADVDPLAIPAGRTPLLDRKPRNVWRSFFCGLDERGGRVALSLLWISILVGAQPRKGKTFTARLLALYAALDPWVKLFIVDGKNSPDWRQFALVADRMVYGTTPNRDGDPLDKLLDTLRLIKQHIVKVNEILSGLPVDVCPEGKLTEALARDPRYPELRVWMLVIEEFQVYFETTDQNINKEIAELLSFVMAVGPSAGVILISCSQKPSGVGAGDVQRLFNRYRDNHTVRIALKCGSRDVSMAVLGGDAYQEGYDASAIPTGEEYRGIGYLYGAEDATPMTRFHLADREDVQVILEAARKHRERAGTLSGEAAGEDVTRLFRDVLSDVRGVFYAGEAWVSWPQLAARLADQIPEHYADVTAGAVSEQLRALGVPTVNGRDKADGNRVTKGAKAKDVDAAAERKALTSV